MSGDLPEVIHLDRDAIKQGLADGSMLLVDVREVDEYEAGHIPGAVLFPLSQFDASQLPEADGKRLVFSCRSGKRSQTAIHHAAAAGLPWREHYAGGILDWVGAGEPVSQG